MSIDDATRHQLSVLARRPRARRTEFSAARPARWQPRQVLDPTGGLDAPFTEVGAWELIASRLEDGHAVEVIELRKPPGATGYVMKIDLGSGAPLVYVKLELRSGRILGRSFHYSDHA